MYMEAGETHTVEELLKGVAMASANDGCVALAEYVAGSEEIFVERMNKRAEELGMRDTHFVNTNGLPVADHYSSAYDIAIMSMELYKHEKTREVLNMARHHDRRSAGKRKRNSDLPIPISLYASIRDATVSRQVILQMQAIAFPHLPQGKTHI